MKPDKQKRNYREMDKICMQLGLVKTATPGFYSIHCGKVIDLTANSDEIRDIAYTIIRTLDVAVSSMNAERNRTDGTK